MNSPFLQCLESAQRVLLVGAGGGYDIFSGLPLFHYLQARGQQVHLANLSFADLTASSGRQLLPGLLEVRPDAGGDGSRFPERYLSEWFVTRGQDVPVYCFNALGARGVLRYYQALVAELHIDAMVLIDGGTDSLMRGDEPGVGSPGEDLASIGAAHLLDLPIRLLACMGSGIDRHHHVCHAYVLEAAADLTCGGDFLGAFSMLPSMPEFQAFADATRYVGERTRPSIVASSIVAAGEGHFGDHHATDRTRGSQLFINPLMSMYWCFTVDGLANRCLYRDALLRTEKRGDVTRAVRDYRDNHAARPWLDLPF